MVSVVIPVLNGERFLAQCLDALQWQVDAPSFEVIVVDNGSTDRTVSIAENHPLGVGVLRELARGPYAARNTGIAVARGKVIALTDSGCIPAPRWIAEALAALDAGADLVGGAVRQRATRSNPTIWERYDRATYLRQDRFIALECFAATANLVLWRSVFDTIGVFHPELVASGDLEFGQRAVKAGFRLVFSAEAEVEREPRTTMRGTWDLHRKLGSGFAELARAGLRGPAWRDVSLRTSLSEAAGFVAEQGPPIRRRRLAPVHVLAMTARWVGRLSARG